MNSGNKKHEEKLKLITLAYTQLKNTWDINPNIDIKIDIKVSIKQTFELTQKWKSKHFQKKMIIQIIKL